MVKDIKYNGYTSVPADYECPDGDLAGVSNVIAENGELSAAMPPKKLFQLDDGYDCVYLHASGQAHNYIVKGKSEDYYYIVEDKKIHAVLWLDNKNRRLHVKAEDRFSPGEEMVCEINYSTFYYVTIGTANFEKAFVYIPDDFGQPLNSPIDINLYALLSWNGGSESTYIQYKIKAGSYIGEFYSSSKTKEEIREIISGGGSVKLATADDNNRTAYRLINDSDYKNKSEAEIIECLKEKVEEEGGGYDSCVFTLKKNLTEYVGPVLTYEQFDSIVITKPLFDDRYALLKPSDAEYNTYYQIITQGGSPKMSLVEIKTFNSSFTIHQINSIGNILIFFTSDGMYYYLWKAAGYLFLGNHLPEMGISFYLKSTTGGLVESDPFSASIENISPYIQVLDHFVESDVPAVIAHCNKFVADKATNAGKFVYPFFVRWAYRLYDGSLAMHSAPIYMQPNTNLLLSNNQPLTHEGSYNWKVEAYITALCMACNNIQLLEGWSDIIKSIDIFITPPEYLHDQNATKISLGQNYSDCCEVNGVKRSGIYVIAPHPKDYSYVTKEGSTFFFLKSISLSELNNYRYSGKEIDIKNDYLSSLVNRELMTDDYDSHDHIMAKYSYTYNNALNITNLAKTFFNGYSPAVETNGQVGSNVLQKDGGITIYIKDGSNEVCVEKECTVPPFTMVNTDKVCAPYRFFFYPNSNAYKMRVWWKPRLTDTPYVNQYIYIDIDLQEHPMLNGAYAYLNFGSYETSNTDRKVSYVKNWGATEGYKSVVKNKLYTSATNNPFVFPVERIITIGSGEIYCLSSATKALSEGQFGEHPMYAFTNEGVWALTVNKSTGGFSTVQPFIRDVITNIESLTQLDNSIVFTSDRGIVHVYGANSDVITDRLKIEKVFDVTTLPDFDKLANLSSIQLENLKYTELRKYLPKSRILYVYVPQRLLVYNTDFPYVYIYSLKTKEWSIVNYRIRGHINSYPMALAMTDDYKLVDFCENATEDEEGNPIKGIKGIVVTRPIKLDAPDTLKTIDTIIQRGTFKRGHVKTALYASNDLFNWQLVWTSQDHYLRQFRGTPYKYFRIVLLCDLEQDESVYGATIQYTPKLTNQPR